MPGNTRSLPIIAIAGQSNADGRADCVNVTNWPALDYYDSYSSVMMMEKHEDSVTDPLVWDLDRGPVSLSPRGGVGSGLKGTMGVEMSLSRRLINIYNYTHAIAKMCVGQSGLNDHWLPTAAYPTAPPNLFAQWMAHLSDAQWQLNGKVVGVIWIQGETDAGDSVKADAYQANLTTLITAQRAYFPNTWWVFNRLSNSASSVPFKAAVRAGQAAVAASVANCYMIDSDDQPIIGQHYVGDGYVGLGNRFADTMSANGLLTR